MDKIKKRISLCPRVKQKYNLKIISIKNVINGKKIVKTYKELTFMSILLSYYSFLTFSNVKEFVYKKSSIRTFHTRYLTTFVNSQHQNTNSKGDFVLKNWV